MRKNTFIFAMRTAVLLCFISTYFSFGQQTIIVKKDLNQRKSKNGFIRCATTENEEKMQTKNPNRMSNSQFENWIAPIIAKQKQANINNKTALSIYTIPVVIHIIHNGDPINTSSSHTGENISDAQAISQIKVLNEDFRKIAGTPGFGNTGYKLGVDCLINFVLAKQDPYGVLTTGIEHINLDKEEWTDDEIDVLVKPVTHWDPTKYLNIWSVKFSVNLLGYAQFPSNSNLMGLDSYEGDANTDGIVLNYDAFGTFAEDDGSFELNQNYNKGRTATHEIGHFLGLRHIWGDGGRRDEDVKNCTTSDFCSDTPQAGWENYDCIISDSCPDISGNDMIENYMDYTNDVCMNTFTAGQRTRMLAVMTNSPRRKELASSTTATPGFTKTLDAALKIMSISTSGCDATFTPSIKIENKGTTNLQTISISYTIDNLNPQVFVWTGTLAQDESSLISIPTIPTLRGTHLFSAQVTAVNNLTDLNNLNNSTSKSYTIASLTQTTGDSTPKITLTLQCDKDGSETTWTLKNNIGTTLYRGGPYIDAESSTELNLPVIETFDLTNGECYTFTINDTYGDGINTNGGVGSYSLKDENNLIFSTGGTFLFNDSKSFSINPSSGNNEFQILENIYLYPNPTKEKLILKTSSEFGFPDRYAISNSLGQFIIKNEVFKETDLVINTSLLPIGVYFITIEKGNHKKTIQFIKE
jgi:hypothetical protein